MFASLSGAVLLVAQATLFMGAKFGTSGLLVDRFGTIFTGAVYDMTVVCSTYVLMADGGFGITQKNAYIWGLLVAVLAWLVITQKKYVAMRTLNHVGIPTSEPKAGENYSEGMKLFLTDYTQCPNRIEWLRFEPDSWMHPLIQNQTHLAYNVTDIEAEMAGKTVLLPPTDCGDGNWIAFVEENGVAVELMWSEKC